MSLDLLGEGFDIHGGGQDLAFPHHENERAQAVAEGRPFARHWVHNGWVVVEGEKMSKSLDNFTESARLRRVVGPPRVPVARAAFALPGADRGDEGDGRRCREGAEAARLVRTAGSRPLVGDAAPDADALDRFRALMDDDLGTPAAIALLFDLVARANKDDDLAAAAAAFEIAGAVGLELHSEAGEVSEDAARRSPGRGTRRGPTRTGPVPTRCATSCDAMGYEVEDGPDGTEIRPR